MEKIEKEKESVSLKKEYTITWMIIFFQGIFAEFFVADVYRDLLFDIMFIQVFIVEMISAWRRGKGDTLSEHMWKFIDAGWSRGILVAGITSWFCLRFAHVGAADADLGRVALSIGLWGWLMIHWLWRGKYG